eukprot:TRINITY_DN24175_c0_g2_i2.p1 TRINITY_DN24175_c0_g2~~TRINITY_DN24175_c0_g2_i2.p1  ORF type:complete len:214 (-),score=-0.31 TRINITY_DN24175_c0_g2_i2:76-717(-)
MNLHNMTFLCTHNPSTARSPQYLNLSQKKHLDNHYLQRLYSQIVPKFPKIKLFLPISTPLLVKSKQYFIQNIPTNPNSFWQYQNSVFLPTLQIVIEKVAIKSRLQQAAYPHYPLSVILLCVVSVNPIKNIETTIAPQQKHVIPREIINIARPLQHHKLRKDGNGLQIYRKSPQNFQRRELVMDEYGEDSAGNEQEDGAEGIVFSVVRHLDHLV